MGWDGLRHDPERVSIVKSVVRARFDALMSGQRVRDDLKVFVKQEAHKKSKLAEGRDRLISAVSLVDTFIDRILFGWMARNELKTCGKTPCMVGWSPVRGGWRQLLDRFKNLPVVCLDKRAWDWTVLGYMVDLWLQFLLELPVNPPQWWKDMVALRLSLLFDDPWFQFSDGTRVQQGVRGIMKSGCFLTILLNSVSQSLLHYIANIRRGRPPGERQPYTLGDDTVQDAMPDLQAYVAELEKLGARVKGAKVRNWVEFAGFAFDGQTCWPAYWQKHLWNMAHTDQLVDVLRSYQYLYVHEPVMSAFIQRVAREVGPHAVMPRAIALDIMDYPN